MTAKSLLFYRLDLYTDSETDFFYNYCNIFLKPFYVLVGDAFVTLQVW